MSDFTTVVPPLEGLDSSKRVNYTIGMVLGVDEFRQEQAYLIGKNRLHNRVLHGYGTVYGLQIATGGSSEDPEIVVSPGLAINPLGQEIEVSPAQCARLNQWLKAHRDDPEMRLSSPPVSPSQPFDLTLYLVLCYTACETDNISLPGTPCRKEEDTFAASRLKDDFELKLSFRPPPLLEETAIRRFGNLLNRIEISSEAPVYLLEADPEGLVNLVRQLGEVSAEECLSPETPGSPSPLEEIIFLRPETACEDLRKAFRVWVTETRPRLLERQAAAIKPGDENCVLLAKIEFTVNENYTVEGDVSIDQTCRPYLLQTRLLQEWIMCGRGTANVSRGGDNVFATLFVLDQRRLDIWIHHPEALEIPANAANLNAVLLEVNGANVNNFSIAPVAGATNLFRLTLGAGVLAARRFEHRRRIEVRFDTRQITAADGASLAEIIAREDYDYLNRDENQIITIYDTISLLFLNDLLDVKTTVVADGQLLKYKDSFNRWEPGNLSLDELTDVKTGGSPGPAGGDVLTWNAAENRWEPAAPAGGSGNCLNLLDDLRSDGIVRNDIGELGFEVYKTGSLDISYTAGTAFVGGCRYAVNSGSITADPSSSGQRLVVDNTGTVVLITSTPLPAKYADIAIISTYDGDIIRIIDTRLDISHLDEKVQNNTVKIAANHIDRRQFVPLLAYSINNLRFRNGRNKTFAISSDPLFNGGLPYGLVSDGDNIWVSNFSGPVIAKIPRSASNLGEIKYIPLSPDPDAASWAVAYDGNCLWFTMYFLNRVIRLNPNDIGNLHEINVGEFPMGIAFDGAFMWVCNNSSRDLSAIDIHTLQVVRTVSLEPDSPESVAFDGTHLWIAARGVDAGGLSILKLYRIESPGGNPENIPIANFPYNRGYITFDGTNMWISNRNGSLMKVEISSLMAQSVLAGIPSSHAISFDGRYIWVLQRGAGTTLYKIDPETNELSGSSVISDQAMTGAFDGTHLWISTSEGVQKKLV